MSVVFDTPEAIAWYRATVILSAIRCYLKTGIKVNAAYTPRAMRAAVSGMTGRPYPRSRPGLCAAERDLAALLGRDSEAG